MKYHIIETTPNYRNPPFFCNIQLLLANDTNKTSQAEAVRAFAIQCVVQSRWDAFSFCDRTMRAMGVFVFVLFGCFVFAPWNPKQFMCFFLLLSETNQCNVVHSNQNKPKNHIVLNHNVVKPTNQPKIKKVKDKNLQGATPLCSASVRTGISPAFVRVVLPT